VPKFELVDPSEVPTRKGAPVGASTIEEWCHAIAAHECHEHRKHLPAIRFRYSQATKGRYAYWPIHDEGHEAWARARIKRDGEVWKVRERKDYCGIHEDDDMCNPIREYRVKVSDEKAESKYSSGRAWAMEIVCTFGTDDTDRKLTFLHELAHVLVGTDNAHNAKFWRKAFDLFDKYGIQRDYYIWRSERYIKLAGKVAAQTGRVERGN
jgi:hypothetical protein